MELSRWRESAVPASMFGHGTSVLHTAIDYLVDTHLVRRRPGVVFLDLQQVLSQHFSAHGKLLLCNFDAKSDQH